MASLETTKSKYLLSGAWSETTYAAELNILAMFPKIFNLSLPGA